MNKNSAISGDVRVGVFVDVHSLFQSAKKLHRAKVNYKALLDEIAFERNIVMANAYVLYKDEKSAMPFFSSLKGSGYDVKKKQMIYRSMGENDKGRNMINWNIGITIDVIKSIPKIDTAIIIVGSGCFIDLVKYVTNEGVRVEIAGFGHCVSGELKEHANDFIDLNHPECKDNILIDGKFGDKDEDIVDEADVEIMAPSLSEK